MYERTDVDRWDDTSFDVWHTYTYLLLKRVYVQERYFWLVRWCLIQIVLRKCQLFCLNLQLLSQSHSHALTQRRMPILSISFTPLWSSLILCILCCIRVALCFLMLAIAWLWEMSFSSRACFVLAMTWSFSFCSFSIKLRLLSTTSLRNCSVVNGE
jgi:hypothetical protein